MAPTKNSFINPIRPVSVVPLKSLQVLAGYLGLANREVKPRRVAHMAEHWDEPACGVLVVWQESPNKPCYILSGHHRYEAMQVICKSLGIDPKNRIVRVDILTPADAQAAGLTPRDFILKVVRDCNEQGEQKLTDTLQNEQGKSPWVKAAASKRLIVDFDSTKRGGFNWSAILRAYVSVVNALEDLASGKRDGITIASRFRIQASHGDIEDAFHHPNVAMMNIIVDALADWQNRAANPMANPPKGKRKVSLFSPQVLTFVMLAHLDPGNRAHRAQQLKELPLRFVNPTKDYVPLAKGSDVAVINHLLDHANKHRKPNAILTVLGLYALPVA